MCIFCFAKNARLLYAYGLCDTLCYNKSLALIFVAENSEACILCAASERSGVFYCADLHRKGVFRVDYKEAYFELYGEIADLIEHLEKIQQKYEEKYISEADKPENE